ncbi:MAG: phosphatase PAP2 family protein [Luteimonas sp.]
MSRARQAWSGAVGGLVAAALLTFALQHYGGDVWLADRLYRWEGGHWALRDAWWTSRLLHDGGRFLTVLAWAVGAGVMALDARRRVLPVHWRAALRYLVAAIALCAVLVAALKRASGIDCPWDLLRYGGERIWSPPLRGAGTCFPAGHAGAGYAWIALYFALARAAPRWRWRGLWGGLALGGVFGVIQQLRGAHFLSHDVAALLLCTGVAMTLSVYWPWPSATMPDAGPR